MTEIELYHATDTKEPHFVARLEVKDGEVEVKKGHGKVRVIPVDVRDMENGDNRTMFQVLTTNTTLPLKGNMTPVTKEL